MICAGIDAGSRAIKVALVDSKTYELIGYGVADQGVKQCERAVALLEQTAADAGVARPAIRRIVATGYGRNAISIANSTVTEITCHAHGVRKVMPGARTVVDIGGQDSKLVRLDPDGKVRDFVMNDRCAAGTGRFLEVVASRLEVALSELGPLAKQSLSPAVISSMCVVFAETEIVGLLAAGTAPADIAAGIQASIASRVAAMAGGKPTEPVAFTGGVALVPGMDTALAAALGRPVTVVKMPQMAGALGAALMASSWHG